MPDDEKGCEDGGREDGDEKIATSASRICFASLSWRLPARDLTADSNASIHGSSGLMLRRPKAHSVLARCWGLKDASFGGTDLSTTSIQASPGRNRSLASA